MNKISKFVHFLASGPARDNQFESYYGALARSRYNGGPSASEARRDFEVVRRTADRAIIF
ncbi:MAG TPA: hypothetical protein VF201_06460 [Nitrolancea sp.]